MSIIPLVEHNFERNTLVSRVTPESIILYFPSIISSIYSLELAGLLYRYRYRYRSREIIDMHNGRRVNDVTYCYNFGFLHTNEVSSPILMSVTLV